MIVFGPTKIWGLAEYTLLNVEFYALKILTLVQHSELQSKAEQQGAAIVPTYVLVSSKAGQVFN